MLSQDSSLESEPVRLPARSSFLCVGEKTQRFLNERWQQLRSALPAPEHVQQYAQHVADRVSQAASEVKDTAQQAVKKVRDTGSDLGDLAQQKAMTMKQNGQDGGAKIKEMVKQG